METPSTALAPPASGTPSVAGTINPSKSRASEHPDGFVSEAEWSEHLRALTEQQRISQTRQEHATPSQDPQTALGTAASTQLTDLSRQFTESAHVQARGIKSIASLAWSNHLLLKRMEEEREEHAKQLAVLLQGVQTASEWAPKAKDLEAQLAALQQECQNLKISCMTANQQWQKADNALEKAVGEIQFYKKLVQSKDEQHKEAYDELLSQYEDLQQENKSLKDTAREKRQSLIDSKDEDSTAEPQEDDQRKATDEAYDELQAQFKELQQENRALKDKMRESYDELLAQFEEVQQENKAMKERIREHEQQLAQEQAYAETGDVTHRIYAGRPDDSYGPELSGELMKLSPAISLDGSAHDSLTQTLSQGQATAAGSGSFRKGPRDSSAAGQHSNDGGQMVAPQPLKERVYIHPIQRINTGSLNKVQEDHENKLREKDTQIKLLEKHTHRLEASCKEMEAQLHQARQQLESYRLRDALQSTPAGSKSSRRLSVSEAALAAGSTPQSGTAARASAGQALELPLSTSLTQQMLEVQEQMEERQAELQRLLDDLKSTQTQLYKEQAALSSVQSQLSRDRSTAESARQELERLQAQLAAAQAELTALQSKVKSEQSQVKTLHDERLAEEDRLALLHDRIEQAGLTLEQPPGSSGSMAPRTVPSGVTEGACDKDLELARLREDSEVLSVELAQAQQRSSDYKRKCEQLQREADHWKATVAHLERQSQEDKDELQEAQQARDTVEQDLARAQEEARRLTDQLRRQGRELSDLQAALAAAEARAQAAQQHSRHTLTSRTSTSNGIPTDSHSPDPTSPTPPPAPPAEDPTLRQQVLLAESQVVALQGELAAVRARLQLFMDTARQAAQQCKEGEPDAQVAQEVLLPLLGLIRDTEMMYSDQGQDKPCAARIRLLQGQMDNLLRAMVDKEAPPGSILAAVRAAATTVGLPQTTPGAPAPPASTAVSVPPQSANGYQSYDHRAERNLMDEFSQHGVHGGHIYQYGEAGGHGQGGMDWSILGEHALSSSGGGGGVGGGGMSCDSTTLDPSLSWTGGPDAAAAQQASRWAAKGNLAPADDLLSGLDDLGAAWELPELAPPPAFLNLT